jgi:tRNA-dihydrouridine synthase B
MINLGHPITIRNLTINNRAFLAPLAGVSDVPFRRICQEFGAGLTFVEMLSAKAIKYQNKKTLAMMTRDKNESILGVQVTGSNAQDISDAIKILAKMPFDAIDINMGCPVKKVTKVGCGSALLLDLDRLGEVLLKAREATDKPLSAKIRLGFYNSVENVTKTAALIAQCGFDMLTIHGRFRSDRYSVPCNHEKIEKGITSAKKFSENIICIGNGDVFHINDAQAMLSRTKCEGVMVSRGSLGNPWVFQELVSNKTVTPNIEDWRNILMRHISYQESYYGDNELSAVLLRKHFLWYAKGFPEVKSLKVKLSTVKTLMDAREIIDNFCAKFPKNLIRSS